jgi:hypothetical protein
MEINFVEILVFLASATGLYLLIRLLKHYKNNPDAIEIIVFAGALLLNKSLFSGTIIIDKFDNIITPAFYNWWSIFLLMQGAVSILWLVFKYTRRWKK